MKHHEKLTVQHSDLSDFYVCIVGLAVAASFIALAVIQSIDKATERQCATHDWPKSADQLHRDWCLGAGYKI